MEPMTSGGKTLVFFDLETTGLDTSVCEVIQLAAISGERSFNVFTKPATAITHSAADVTGFSVKDGALLRRGAAVPTVPLSEALTSFLTFLGSFKRPVLLAAHNAKRFDRPVLTRALRSCSLSTRFRRLDARFLDTFLLSKVLYPWVCSYSQVNLVRHFLGKAYDAHDALEDAKALQELYGCWDPDQGRLTRCFV